MDCRLNISTSVLLFPPREFLACTTRSTSDISLIKSSNPRLSRFPCCFLRMFPILYASSALSCASSLVDVSMPLASVDDPSPAQVSQHRYLSPRPFPSAAFAQLPLPLIIAHARTSVRRHKHRDERGTAHVNSPGGYSSRSCHAMPCQSLITE